MKKLLFENSHVIKLETAEISQGEKPLNELNAFFQKNQLGPLSYDTVTRLLFDPQKTIRNIVKSKIPDIDQNTGLANDKEKILETLQGLPYVNPHQLVFINLLQKKELLSLYDFDEVITVNTERLEEHLDRHRYYSDDPDVLDAYNELLELTERLNSFNEKVNIISVNAQTFGPSDKFFNSLSEIFRISEQGLYLTQKGFEGLVVRKLKKQVIN
jgi:hypothetical protein